MNTLVQHIQHILMFDGLLHWCFLLAVFFFLFGSGWVVMRVLWPLRRLAHETELWMRGELPNFEAHTHGIQEIEQLRQSLHTMMMQIKAGQEREAMYRNDLTENQENERLRLAREIHDDTIQSLVLIGHHIERGTSASPSGAQVYLDEARRQLVQTIDNLRGMIANLRPTLLTELGLAIALESLCEYHATLKVRIEGRIYPLEASHELALFRAAQEAIHNAEQHAQATEINLKLHYGEKEVTLEVLDDGIGFSLPHDVEAFALRGHYGLMGIRERITHLGGTIGVNNQKAGGGHVTVILCRT